MATVSKRKESTPAQNGFFRKLEEDLTKTKDDMERENLQSFLEESAIECEQQIATLETSVLPKLKLDLKRAQIEKEKYSAKVEEARFQRAKDFTQYVMNLQNEEEKERECTQKVETIITSMEIAEVKLGKFKNILEDLKF